MISQCVSFSFLHQSAGELVTAPFCWKSDRLCPQIPPLFACPCGNKKKKRKVVHLSFILISVDIEHCVETVKSASTLSIGLIAKGNQGLCAGE